ncbi:hypothetical protein ACFSC3_02245 [Sphingomonas floccifaciens]|uniref:Uncharacterized protein n=1 Tax=Sphingomonas floccifaciens TaxID=1844115 RepID=A0ABW4NA72_9SPHN
MTVAALLLTAAAAQAVGTVPLGDIEAAKTPADTLLLARRILPQEVASKVVAAKVQRRWLPGQVWWIGAREPARVAGADLCEQQVHSVEAAAPSAPGGAAPAETALTIGKSESWTEVAVLPTGVRATATACAGQSYLSVTNQGDRKVAAYRVLRSAMAVAQGRARLPFAMTCRSEAPAACRDARAALASLPMGALGAINISCLDTQKVRADTIIRCPPLQPGQSYQAEVRFGPTGPDGQSWTVAFVHRPGWPEAIDLRRTTIIYH